MIRIHTCLNRSTDCLINILSGSIPKGVIKVLLDETFKGEPLSVLPEDPPTHHHAVRTDRGSPL